MNPRTQQRIETILKHVGFSHWSEDNLRTLRQLIETALREQDRDTRHNCAESMNLNLIENNHFMTAQEVLTRAHAACMNARSI